MELEEIVLKKPRVVRRYPSDEILAQVEKGNKFIVVPDDSIFSNVPLGYTLIDIKHKGVSFKTLVPQSLLFYMANPGEGDPNQALDKISDFYGEVEDFEEGLIENGETNVQEANWANIARGSYNTYLINRLVKNKDSFLTEPVPEFNPEVLAQLDLKDDYVLQRVKAIAALTLEKTADQIKTHEVKDVLKHVDIIRRVKEEVTRKELYKQRCYNGSHWEYRDEYRDVTKTEWVEKKETYSALNTQIGELESQIDTYRRQKHNGQVGRHDSALIREYINLAHITPENPKAQLDIAPPEKPEEKK